LIGTLEIWKLGIALFAKDLHNPFNTFFWIAPLQEIFVEALNGAFGHLYVQEPVH
jgi:uncharacterized membrane-anchored protein